MNIFNPDQVLCVDMVLTRTGLRGFTMVTCGVAVLERWLLCREGGKYMELCHLGPELHVGDCNNEGGWLPYSVHCLSCLL